MSGSAARPMQPAKAAPAARRPGLRVVPGGRTRPPRAPFVVLVLLVLGAGLVGLLLLNTGLQQGSFELRDLQREARQLRDQQAALAQEVARRSTPDELAERAAALGMVPATSREYLVLEVSAVADGTHEEDGVAEENGPAAEDVAAAEDGP
jgi:hypothetical protein